MKFARRGYFSAEPTPRSRHGRSRSRRQHVSAGTYRCTSCGYELQVGSTKNLPPCPSCGNGAYATVTGGDSVDDPYPDRAG
jgi:predicted RNA-binding Zn-ribbon protein involved in translation (DUF1610 family)